MTLPANDAFTLGLAHDETRRPHQSRSRSLPRSPSPKISFSSSKSTIAPTHTSRVERGLARRASKHTSSNRHKDGSGALADGLHNSLTKAVQPPLQEIEEKREDSPTPSPPNPIQKVDWEIPRKLLHSSIGITLVSSPSQSGSPAPPSGFLTLYLYYSNGSPRPVILGLGTALVAVIAPTELVRLHSPRFEKIYERCLGFLMRESEKVKNPSVSSSQFPADKVLTEIYEWCDLVYPRGCFGTGLLPARHRSGVHPYVNSFGIDIQWPTADTLSRLSWADTSASTFGRLWGKKTRALPRTFLGLPFAPRKSLAGFIAASVTGALTAVAFWGWFAPLVNRPEVSWTWVDGFSLSPAAKGYILDGVDPRGSFNFDGWTGLGIIGVFAGIVSGVAEALGD